MEKWIWKNGYGKMDMEKWEELTEYQERHIQQRDRHYFICYLAAFLHIL